jgi:hypothetical protein
MGFGLVTGFIEHFNTHLVITFYRPLSHTDWCSQSQSSLHCLVTSSNSGRSSAPWLTFWQAGGQLTTTSYSSVISTLSLNSSLHSRLGHLREQSRAVAYGHLMAYGPCFIVSAQTAQKTSFPTAHLLLHACLLRPSHDGYLAVAYKQLCL